MSPENRIPGVRIPVGRFTGWLVGPQAAGTPGTHAIRAGLELAGVSPDKIDTAVVWQIKNGDIETDRINARWTIPPRYPAGASGSIRVELCQVPALQRPGGGTDPGDVRSGGPGDARHILWNTK